MTAPRQVVTGRTYLLTRRCTRRQLLLRPDSITNQTFIYCLAVAAARFGVHVHAVMVMSNHYHLVITDVHGNYPEFLRYLNSLLARSLNAHRGRWENFWATEQPSVVHLVDAAAVLDKTVYTLTNPVAAHLVQRVTDWPGVSSLSAQMRDGWMRARRPRHFFREDGDMPEEASLRITPPAQFDHLNPEEWRNNLRSQIREREDEAVAYRARTGSRVLGRRGVLAQRPDSFPPGAEPRRGMVPRVATKNKWLRVERLQRNKVFQELYRAAYELWVAGSDAVFPWGTYKLRLQARVSCDPAPQPAC